MKYSKDTYRLYESEGLIASSMRTPTIVETRTAEGTRSIAIQRNRGLLFTVDLDRLIREFRGAGATDRIDVGGKLTTTGIHLAETA